MDEFWKTFRKFCISNSHGYYFFRRCYTYWVNIKTFLALNNLVNLERNQQFIFNNIKQTDNPVLKLKNKILSQLILRDFFQNKFDKIFPYKKYNFKKEYIPVDIDKMTDDYNNMKL